MKIVGIVGWKNSGKTTIATKIINKLSSKNFRVASIKHAHHEFDIDHENTDSFKHRLAGSSQVIVSSSKRWVKISELNNSKEKTLDELINQLSEIDIVIVEGFKNENHPKIEIIKNDNDNYLFSKIKNSTASIKSILLNHKVISGIGNIYASEILFATNISPTRIGKEVSFDECKKILKESKKILSKAIKAGGTTLNDYFNAESKPGYFKIQLKVYGRDGEKCKCCETNISKITQNNRSTYFCKESQN